jgi:hypothetical protein
MVNRRLVLRRERLDELTTGELGVVVGAAAQTTPCPDYTYYCITGPAICAPSRIICS